MSNPNDPWNPLEQKFDQTLDEKSMGQMMQQGPAAPASAESGKVNPYTQTGRKSTPLGTTSTATLPDGAEPLPLGSGVIDGLLGEGGMARVYRIWNEKLEIYRAVKILLPTGRPELMERFETEVKISAKLHHPNIVDTYAVGEWNGLPYIEMELIEGVSLDALIRQNGKIPTAVCTAIGIHVARALGYAHTQQFLLYGKTYNGIIHRDLKPANIMIGKSGVVKLMDFGIARPSEVGLHTMDGNLVGTLPYLSPEQMDEKEIDQRSDQYAFGAIVYEALVGEKTFPQATMTNLMKMKVMNSYRKFDSFSITIPSSLTKLVEKCLNQEPAARFANALELEQALAAIYKSQSSENTEVVIKRYLDNPKGFIFAPGKTTFQFPIKTKPLIIIAASLILAVGIIFGMIYLLSPANTPDKVAVPSSKPIAPQPAIAVPPPLVGSSHNVKPADTSTPPAELFDKPAAKQQTESIKQKAPTPPPAKPKERLKPGPAAESPLKLLCKKYSSDDLVVVGEAACKAGVFSEALTALGSVPASHPQKAKADMLLAYTYLEQNKVAKAAQISGTIPGDDAFLVLIKGRIALAQGNIKQALDYCEQAITRPSDIRSALSMRCDALYYTALANDTRYSSNPTAEYKQQTLLAWNNLKRIYMSQPDNPRFKMANQKLASF